MAVLCAVVGLWGCADPPAEPAPAGGQPVARSTSPGTQSPTAAPRPAPPSHRDPNAPPQLNPNDPSPGIDRAVSITGNLAGPPSNAIQQNSFQEAPAPQPDPGPAPATPTPDTTGCDPGMVRVETGTGAVCVHQYEVSLQLREARPGMVRQYLHQPSALKLVSDPGWYPSTVSWSEAARICGHFGYRLCTSAEWEDICDGVPGEGGHAYSVVSEPDTYAPGACVFTHTRTGGMVPLQKSGSKPWCATPTGVYDLLGNVWEWTDPQLPREGGQAVTDKRGGAHYGRELATCSQTSVGTHGPNWLGSVGFRCCATPKTP